MATNNYIHDFTVHNTPYDIDAEKSQYSHYALSANWLYNADDSHYHFSVKNLSANAPLYDTNGTIIYNNYLDVIEPKFDSDESVPVIFKLANKIDLPLTVDYVVNDKQKNYSIQRATNFYDSTYGSCTEYMGQFNSQGYCAQMARIPFRFSCVFTRITSRDDPTPDFDSAKPIAKITKIGNISVDNLYITGPAYVLGSCILRRTVNGQPGAFPATTFRVNSREMFFWMNTDATSNEYCNIYVCPTNCKAGVNTHSLYHCSYTPTQCRNLAHIEVEFNTVLYITFR